MSFYSQIGGQMNSYRLKILSAQKPGLAEGEVKHGAVKVGLSGSHLSERWSQQLLPHLASGTSSLEANYFGLLFNIPMK